MQPINRVNFEILKKEDPSAEPTFDQAIGLTLDWLKSRNFVEDPGAVLDLVEATSEVEVGAGVQVESMVLEDDEKRAWGIRYSHPDRSNPGLRWIGEITLCDKGGSQIYYSNTLGISQSDERVAPVEVLPSNPTLNREILAALKGQTRHKHRLFPKPHVLNGDSASIDIFVRIVANTERSHPLVLVTPGSNNLPLVNANALARSLAGMAHVLVAESTAAATAAAKALPSGLGCQGGGVRIYWPDFHQNKDAHHHDLFLDWEVLKCGDKFPGRLVEIISRQAVIRIPEDYISWGDLKTASLRRSIESESTTEDTLGLLKLFEEENIKLQSDLVAANEKVSSLNKVLDKIRQQVAQIGMALEDVASEASPEPAELSSEYEAVNEDEPIQNPEYGVEPENDDSEPNFDEAGVEGGLPFYNYDTYLSRIQYVERQAHPKGATGTAPPTTRVKPESVRIANGAHARAGDWVLDENYGFGKILELHSEFYHEALDKHKIWFFNAGKPMTMSNHKLRVQGIRVVEIREVPVEVLELFETMESKS
jgi:hypothetical protein